MPAAEEESGPYRLLSTIYRQSWPPPPEMTFPSGDNSRDRNPMNRSKNGGELPRSSSNINRPFSASLVSPGREKATARPMSARRPSQTFSTDARALNSATFQKRTPTNSRIPKYDRGKVISESAAARNKALAAEYIAMLQGRNYLKKQYREQYWVNDNVKTSGPPTGRYSGERRYPTLYRDLGSVIGGRVPFLSGTSVAPNSPPRSSDVRHLSTASSTSESPPGKKDSVNIPKASNNDTSTTVSELGLTFSSKRSWSNVPSGRSYRVLSHPNDTLASLCLEGRAASRTSNSRTSSLSSTVSLTGNEEGRRALSSAGESTPSGSSGAISGKSVTGSGDEDPTKSFLFTGTENVSVSDVEIKTEFENDREFSVVHGISDSAFVDDDNYEFLNTEEEEEIERDQREDDDEYEENLQGNGADRLSYSDLEESDISENEADDYDEDEQVDEEEVNRRLQQVSAVFDSSRDSLSPNHDIRSVTEIVDSVSECDSSETKVDESSETKYQAYEFANFLPHPYSKYDLKSFAALPAGMDWRDLLHPNSPKKKGSGRQQFRRPGTDKRRLERRAREREEKRKKSLEDTVDRLIMLEKMQAMTAQYEQDKRKHVMHRAKARKSTKAATNNQNNAATSNLPNNELRPQSARVTRRRSSTVSTVPAAQVSCNKPRKSCSSVELRKEAVSHKSTPDLELVRLSCTKNHLQYVRHSSFSYRRRNRFGFPRYYEYSWSERVQPSKSLSLNSLVYLKPRNCQSCRESDKRLAQVHTVQMMLGRPRSSCCTFSIGPQRLVARPNTSSTSVKTPGDISQGTKENRSNKDHTISEKLKISSPNRDITVPATFRRLSTKNSSAQEKIFAARAILSSVARDYARAARREGKLNRRSSAPNMTATRPGWISPTGGIRYRKDANVLKTHIIDPSNLRLR